MQSAATPSTTDRDTWAEALRLLDDAIDLPSSRHDAWLAGVAVGSPAVRALLTRLLAERAAIETAAFLQGGAPLPVLPGAGFEAGQLVGPYRLVRLLGEGGMAVVWLAERADAAHRRPVALKLPQLEGGRARAIAERFLRERVILSDLAHPNIASVLDAGSDTSDLGVQPWLAMEFVDGQPLTRHCAEHALDLPTRLRLFVQVLRAVQYAHAQGVIHRDLKPGNVLVDRQAQIKLVDFGVAKLLASDEHEGGMTQWAGRPLTPDYASPEQLAGRPVGTGTDVYSLGVMLYELLVGQRPHAIRKDANGSATLPVDPPRPSRAAAAQTSPDAHRRAKALAGDLDTIVLKAMQREPDARYATVAAFAEDIERHLQSRPILARPDRAWYRAAKFTARHRLGVAVSTAIVTALSIALATALWQARLAKAESARAEATKRFLVGLFDNSARQGADETPAYQLTGKDLLETGTKRLLTDYREPSELRLELLNLLGELSEQLDLLPQAQKLLEEATALTRQLHGEDDVRYAHALLLVAEVQARASEHEVALQKGRDALAHFERLRAPPVELVAQNRILIGNVLDQLERHDESQVHLEAAVKLLKEADSTSEQRSRASFYLARTFEASRELDRAERQYLDGIAQAERNFGPRSYIAAFGYENYGDLLRQMARFDDAQRYLVRALDVYAVVLGPRHLTVSGAQYELAQVLAVTGRRVEADRMMVQSIATSDAVSGPFQPNVGGYQMGRRAALLLAMGRFDDARALYEQVLAHWPPGDALREQRISVLGLGYARLLTAEGDLVQAATLLDEVDRSLASKPADDRYAVPERVILAARRSELARVKGDAIGARRLLDAVLRQPLPAAAGDLSAPLVVMDALGRVEPDADTARAALATFAALGDDASFVQRDVENRARVDLVLGRLLLRAGDAPAAQARLARAVALRERIDVPDSPWLADARLSLAESLVDLRQAEPARALLDGVAGALATHPRAGELNARLVALRARLIAAGPTIRENT